MAGYYAAVGLLLGIVAGYAASVTVKVVREMRDSLIPTDLGDVILRTIFK
jgi:hypothetical protein